MKVRLFPILLIGLTGLSVPGMEPLHGQMGVQEVQDLRFQGNQSFPDEALANAILTRETECRSFIFYPFCALGADFSLDPHFFSEREFVRDHARVKLFYFLRGFRETVVDTLVSRVEGEGVGITFLIEEGAPIQVVDLGFEVWDELPDSAVLEDLPLKEGEPLSMVALDATRDTLETRLRNSGFANADVLRNYTIDSAAPHEAQVSFDVYPGISNRFGPLDVEILGVNGRVPAVDEKVVRRMLPYKEGDPYKENLRFEGQRTLYNLGIFRAVKDTLLPPVNDSILPVRIQLQEGDIHRVRTGGGYSNAECFNVEAQWNSRNFFGGARRLQVTGRVSNILTDTSIQDFLCRSAGEGDYAKLTGSVSIDFSQPWFFSARNAVAASLYLERQSVPDLFVQEALGITLGFTRSLSAPALLGMSFQPRLSKLDAAQVFFCSVYLICDAEEIEILQSSNWLSPLSVSLAHDRRNQLLNPTRGYLALVDLEHAGSWTGSDFRYTRLISEATWHTQNRDRWVLGTRLRGGWVSPEGFGGLVQDEASNQILHPEKRFFGGGANSVRGYAQNRLGPAVLYVEEVEDLLWKDDNSPSVCVPDEIVDGSCDAGGLGDNRFTPTPRGGTRILEGSVEFRFPVSGRLWEGATFLDFGQVWAEDNSVDLGDLELTPGAGVRFFSPIGPIRVDVAYRFGGGELFPVVTEALVPFDEAVHTETQRLIDPNDPENKLPYAIPGDLIVLGPQVLFGENVGSLSWRRFQLHLSIGQAF